MRSVQKQWYKMTTLRGLPLTSSTTPRPPILDHRRSVIIKYYGLPNVGSSNSSSSRSSSSSSSGGRGGGGGGKGKF